MTIAICLSVSDGLVFGADSASTIGGGAGVDRVYTNAEKICNLHKALPVGAVTYGLGSLVGRSITHLAKDLRAELGRGGSEYAIDQEGYTVEEIATHLRSFFYEDLYQCDIVPVIENAKESAEDAGEDPDLVQFPTMGFIVGGFSSWEPKPEIWTVEVGLDGACPGPSRADAELQGIIVYKGVEDPLDRLLTGSTAETWASVTSQGLSADEARDLLVRWAPLAHPAMPIQDAIDLVRYLAQVAAGYIRFSSGPDVVAPPIDLAAITKHERFKWVQRKHYYPPELN